MPDVKEFVASMRKVGVAENLIDQILQVDYEKHKNPCQENANYFARAMPKCEELLGFERTAEIMFGRACCKSGFRLENARKMHLEHGHRLLSEKLEILGTLKYMGQPGINEDGDLATVAVGSYGFDTMSCPCWRLKGCAPADGPMPLAYCLCCAGHFQFHYQKALNLKLRVKQVKSSMLNSGGKEPCVFVYQIIE